MKNVVTFPESKSKKVRKAQKAEAKQLALSVSIVTLILGSVLLTDSFSRSQGPVYIISDNTQGPSRLDQLNRAIASAQPMNPFRDLEWEKSLAKKLGQDASLEERNPASLGRKLSSVEELRFEQLGGNYRFVDQASTGDVQIQEIEYIDPVDVTVTPVPLNPEDFLARYGSLLAVKFESFDRANPNQPLVQEFRLLNEKKEVKGTAAFTMDSDGKFISLKVRAASLNAH